MTEVELKSEEEAELIALLRDSAAAFLAAEHDYSRIRSLRATDAGFDRQMMRKMAEMGWLGVRVPEAAGGAGLHIQAACILAELFGKALLPEPYVLCAVVSAALLANADQDGVGQELLSGLAGGDTLLAPALFEELDQIDVLPIATSLDKRADGFRLNGEKLFALFGVDRYLVSARAGDDVVLVVLDANAPGVARAQRRMADGTVACDLSFVDVEIGDSAIVARGAVADAAIARSIKEGALVISAQLVGIARGAMDIALGYLRQREQFGKPIGSFQALQHRAVDLLLQIEVADAAWHNAARRYTENPDAGSTIAAVSAAKARCSEVALAVSRAAIQFHGAIGYTDEADIGLFLKAAMRLAPMLGSVSRHRHRFFDVSFHGSNKELAA